MLRAVIGCVSCVLAACGSGQPAAPAPGPDPLAAEIERESELLRADSSTDEISVAVREAAGPVMEEARTALGAGRRLLALHRLLAAAPDLQAARYLRGRNAAGAGDSAGFEAEWKRMGGELAAAMSAPSAGAFDGMRPAALRAFAEAALPQVRLSYEASLEYGRSTMPDAGLFYLGAAVAERDQVAMCRSLAARWEASGDPLPLRSLAAEIDGLEAEILAAYRPPASIDRHPQFIAASSMLKGARELDAAGLRHGALLRYLQAALHSAPLRRSVQAEKDRGALSRDLRALEARLQRGDHTVGRLFVEVAEADLDAAEDPGVKTAAVVADVLPRYFAALQPAPGAPAEAEARVTVTLVRWPFT